MEEIWKDVAGYEGYYQVSNLGRVRSLDIIDTNGHKHKGRILNNCIIDKYYGVYLYKNTKRKTFLIHRLVAQAFLPNPNNLPEVGHKDEQNLKNSGCCNNCVDNLEWNSSKDNANMPNRKKRLSISNQNKCYGLNSNAKSVICENIIFSSIKECAEFYNINYTEMVSWLSGHQKMPETWIKKGLNYV